MRRMYSENQLKKLISEYSGDIIKVSNIKNLTDDQCNSLECGDMVAKKTGKQYHLYLVTYKQAKHGLCLSYFDASVIETQSYDYTEGHWVYNSEDKTELGDGTEVVANPTLEGNEAILKGLQVGDTKFDIAKGYVKVIQPPNPNELTDEEVDFFKKGVFVQGTLTISNNALNNPVFFPAGRRDDNNYRGCVITGGSPGHFFEISEYRLSPTSKTLSIVKQLIDLDVGYDYFKIVNLYSLNGKPIPEYPANTGTFTLKCVDGVLTWVQDQ